MDLKAVRPTSSSVELCLVCGDRASGRHYGAISCEGCKGFFKRSIRKQLGYQCRGQMKCEVTKHHRNRCQYCRLQKCLASGMRSDSVQHERKPIVDAKKENIVGLGSTPNGGIVNPMNQLNCFNDNNLDEDITTKLTALMNMSDLHQQLANYNRMYMNACDIKAELENDNNSTSGSVSQQSITVASPLELADMVLNNAQSENECIKNEEFSVQLNESLQDNLNQNDSLHQRDLVDPETVSFHIEPPMLALDHLASNYICETGSRLLFATIRWCKHNPIFKTFSPLHQEAIMKFRWQQLFVLGVCQMAPSLNIHQILSKMFAIAKQSRPTKDEENNESIAVYQNMANNVWHLNSCYSKLEKANDYEFAYLRLAVMSAPDLAFLTSSEREKCNRVHELSLQALRSAVELSEREDSMTASEFSNDCRGKFEQFIAVLQQLREFNGPALELLFFRHLVGELDLGQIILCLIKSDIIPFF